MSYTDLENEITDLENAEKLLLIYDNFLNECPTETELKQKNKNVELKAVVYAIRTEIYKSALSSAFALITKVKENLIAAVEKMTPETKKSMVNQPPKTEPASVNP